MTPDWTALDQELALWQQAGLTLPLWWRDDDAIQPTPALERLAELSGQLGLPVHLAVIPRDASEALARYCSRTPQLIPVVHGWAHRNHAPAAEKKAEFGAHRPLPEVLAEAEQGLTRLRSLFADRMQPMFVPPWNRISAEAEQGLAGLGYSALSAFKPRSRAEAAPGLARINTHLDPIRWKGNRSLVPPQDLLDQLTRQLQDRRLGRAGNAEPYGLLTHHLVHDSAIWEFTRQAAARLLDGPAQPWTLEKGLPI